jgi:hypothetical protein
LEIILETPEIHTAPTQTMVFSENLFAPFFFLCYLMLIAYVLCVGFGKSQEMITQDARGR